jgi:hypothetical protein
MARLRLISLVFSDRSETSLQTLITARIAEQHFRRGLYHTRPTGPSRPKEQQVPYRPPKRIQPGTKHLVQGYNGLHRFVLPHDL